LGDDEPVLFADAPEHEKLALEQTSEPARINIHGAIDLATGPTTPSRRSGS
jgi:hypothetical protein